MILSQGYYEDIKRILYIDMVGKDTLLQLVEGHPICHVVGRVTYCHWWEGHAIASWWAWNLLGIF